MQDQDLFYIVNYDIKLGTTPWTYSIRTYCIVSAVLQKVLLSVAVCIEASCASVKAPVPSRFSYQNLGNIGVGPCRPTLAEPEQDYPDTRNPKQNNLLRKHVYSVLYKKVMSMLNRTQSTPPKQNVANNSPPPVQEGRSDISAILTMFSLLGQGQKVFM